MENSGSLLYKAFWFVIELIGILSVAGYIAMHATLASRDVVSIIFGTFLFTLVCLHTHGL